MAFNIVHGGLIRKSAVVSSSETVYWTKGRILNLDTSGQIRVTTSPQTFAPIGIALEDRPNTTSVGVTTTVTKVGAPSGEQASFIMDPAVITMEQNLESGVVFTPGNKLYVSTNGKVTTSGTTYGANAMPSSSPIIGVALTAANSADTQRPLTFFFQVNY